MKRILLALATAALIAGCGSSVNLDDVAVEDKSGTPVTGQSATGAATGNAAAGNAGAVGSTAIAPVAVGRAGPNMTVPSGQRIVYFDYDSYAIKAEFQDVIETQARYIKANRNRKVSIEGHTDERGGREYNLALGQKRSEAVRRALVLLGVVDGQLEAVSFGKEKPAVAGSDEATMAKNRRAEITYQ